MRVLKAVRLLPIVLISMIAWGCSSVGMPGVSPVPCSRVELAEPPPWTASAAWDGDEDEMLLIDPNKHALVTYGRDGQRRREVDLDAIAEINYSVPMRLQRTDDGVLLIDQKKLLYFDDELNLLQRREAFAGFDAKGLTGGSLNDVLLVNGKLQGFADFIDLNAGDTQDDEVDKAEGEDEGGTWRRGFMRLDGQRSRLDLLHEFPLVRGGEFDKYYYYGGRPYVTEVDGKVYVLRFTEPWSIHRLMRREIRQVVAGDPADGERISGIYGWNGRIYALLRRQVIEKVEDQEGTSEEKAAQPTLPKLKEGQGNNPHETLRLMRAELALEEGRIVWELAEIDPGKGRILRRIELPSAADSLRLVTGSTFWTAIEDTSGPNLGRDEDRTSFLFMPARELLAGNFSCGAGTESPPSTKEGVAVFGD